MARVASSSGIVIAVRGALGYVADAQLRSYAQILFGRSRVVGLLLLAATAVSPTLALAGAVSVLLATAAARVLELSEELIRSGLFGYNALLMGLGWASLFEPRPITIAVLGVAVVASVFITAAVHSALGSTFNLPALTAPFLLVFPLVLAAGGALGLQAAPLGVAGQGPALPLPVELFLRSLGAIFFLPRVDAGLLVLLALVVYSRVGTLLALTGFVLAQLVGQQIAAVQHPMLPLVLGYNFLLTAQALGGVWFVPSRSSFVFAGVGSLVAGLIGLGLLPRASFGGVPLLILPFNLTVFLLLYAMRQRSRDRKPKSVDFLLGTPEENLNYFRTRLSRFGANYVVRFSAPFLGRWVCTQGVDGDRTHKGPWRHAFDFEVAGPDGRTHRGGGRSLGDFHCYRLPVIAPADGTVVTVVDGVPDNRVGEVNLKDNWGNLVVIYHGPGLYSLICHLSPGTIAVHQGEPVRQGDRLGLCGASGRAPTPHVHFQLQATARIGAPTLIAELHDVVQERVDGVPVLHGTCVTKVGDVLRNLEPEEDVGRMLAFGYGEPIRFTVSDGGAQRTETVVPDIDLYGNLLLRSEDRQSTLFYDDRPGHFTVFDTIGRWGSALHLIQCALSRVPFEALSGLEWRDVLPLRHFLPWWARGGLDLVSPFVRDRVTGVEVAYHMQREGRRVQISGASNRLHRGEPLVCTEAVLLDGLGIESVQVTVRGRTLRAERAAHDAAREDCQALTVTINEERSLS